MRRAHARLTEIRIYKVEDMIALEVSGVGTCLPREGDTEVISENGDAKEGIVVPRVFSDLDLFPAKI